MSNWKTMPVHPLAAIFPRPTEVEFAALISDMCERGFDRDQPIITADGKILDGISRRDAAIVAGVEPCFKEHKSNDLIGFVISRNLHRRHLSDSQRKMLAADLVNLCKESQVQDSAPLPNTTWADAAKLTNVNQRGAEEAGAVQRDAVPEVVEAVRKGTVSIHDAKKIKDEKPAAQRRAVRDVESGKTSTARAAIHPGESERQAADERLKRQKAGNVAADADTVPCPHCKGTGRMTAKKAAAAAKFVPPTLEEVTAYCHERKNKVDPEAFIAHYTSNGWKVGKSPMKDWKAAILTWEKNDFTSKGKSNGKANERTRHEYDPAVHGKV